MTLDLYSHGIPSVKKDAADLMGRSAGIKRLERGKSGGQLVCHSLKRTGDERRFFSFMAIQSLV